MQLAVITIEDYAKFPFLKNASSKIQNLDLTLQSIVEDDFLSRAENRVENAIQDLTIGDVDIDPRKEISSFAASLILVIATKNPWIKKRYALAIAKTAYVQMRQNSTENRTKELIFTIAKDFDWHIIDGTQQNMDFGIGFTYFLNNAAHLHDKKWKLVNQIFDKGVVYLNKDAVARLIQEEIKRRVEKRLETDQLASLPEDINIAVHRLTQKAQEVMGQEIEEMPKIVSQDAFPPCIETLIEDSKAAHHLSHMGRFTLTSFLVNIGMSSEAIAEMYKTFSDYNERLTRYQIEHIAGERGSGTRYTCPQCSVLQTHGVCRNKDELCRKIFHPLKYYLNKQKRKM